MSKFILVHFRGGSSDKAYKDPGDLYAYGPFDSLEIVEAWRELVVEDSVFDREYALPDVSLILSIEDNGIFNHNDHLVWGVEPNGSDATWDSTPRVLTTEPDIPHWEQWTETWKWDRELPTTEQIELLDIVYPTWKADLAEVTDTTVEAIEAVLN